jgi:hypothetical protein
MKLFIFTLIFTIYLIISDGMNLASYTCIWLCIIGFLMLFDEDYKGVK